MIDHATATDVEIRNNDLSAAPGLPLVLVVRNERFLLPDFLDHYRALGVERFFVLDDASDDGTPDFLATQPDVCLLASSYRYGDKPDPDSLPPALRGKPDTRMIHVWRTGLMNRFCADGWALQCDADEFLLLPSKTRLPDVIARLEAEHARGAWGGMIDLYPRSISDLSAYDETGFVYPKAAWFFDGVRHFSMRKGKPPRHHYVGVRHRLDVAFADKPDLSRFQSLKLRLRGARKSPSGTLVKPILQRWSASAYYLNSHVTTLPLSCSMLLPLLHYRYTPGMLRKLEWALEAGGYSKGNADYQRVDAMLARMRREQASFMSPLSVPLTGFDSLRQTCNAIY
ncbi:glycosyltransferase family 2 protein [Pseudoponticoccus marisrubri]|uniref:Glycosyl transferase family 2 n=1 Tax=Pseudoponticoccus marisrubri TaxID=1685382 RepID=A0A0W7WMD0_9RHOB|nr:glycosyltransferase family 2 protein [Pseudoponticoccus marisrubri]KUF11742.1 hypothetical protein AVJ23_03915 [Pseudoponticoccus marisrubri]